ncbi:hypothetical protein GUJ93_ZPchr0006g41226 [Zizania palustris]|uniref:Uncharacterized protein n=1 Tax=Zizania palustris TaxID=103762 RepID=A0A8J5T650_ZIZPA|nr:hypothetical protein GUJ93_ZPchr0006g41226 [Zizania palustris]
MPKNMGIKPKVEEARKCCSATESDHREHVERAKEEEYWREAEGPKSRTACHRKEDAEKRAATAVRKAENYRLAKAEATATAVPSKIVARKASHIGTPVPKVIEAKLTRWRKEERLCLRQGHEGQVGRQ